MNYTCEPTQGSACLARERCPPPLTRFARQSLTYLYKNEKDKNEKKHLVWRWLKCYCCR